MGEWQDISTAPKDGTRILIWCNWPTLPSVYACSFECGQWQTGIWTAAKRPGPTHWQPLPAPPAAQRDMQEVGG